MLYEWYVCGDHGICDMCKLLKPGHFSSSSSSLQTSLSLDILYEWTKHVCGDHGIP